MAHLTKKGARSVTADLDRLAELIQHRFDVLGLPEKVAADFAHKCDLLSDHIERYAIHLAGEQASEEAEEEPEAEKVPEEKKASSKKAKDETGLSVEPGPANQGFDANTIADATSGPLEVLPPVEGFMNGFFTQKWFEQLRLKQQGGDIGFFVSASDLVAMGARIAAELSSKKAGEEDAPVEDEPSAKKAEEAPVVEEKEEVVEDVKKAAEDEEDSVDKSASNDFGYRLFD